MSRAWTIPGGQAHLKGKIFRMGHLGYMDDFDIMNSISAVEIVLSQMGYDFVFGDGIKRAQECLSDVPAMSEGAGIR